MELRKEQVEKFVSLHSNGELDGLTPEQVSEIANGVARHFLTRLQIYIRQQKEKQNENIRASDSNQDTSNQ